MVFGVEVVSPRGPHFEQCPLREMYLKLRVHLDDLLLRVIEWPFLTRLTSFLDENDGADPAVKAGATVEAAKPSIPS